jgi:hypothetical protein
MRNVVCGSTLLLVVGCANYATFNPINVRTVAVSTTDGTNGYCVGGAPPQLKATVTLESGKQLQTWEWLRAGGRITSGRVEYDAFEWSSGAGSRIDDEGRLLAYGDPLTLLGEPIPVRVAVKNNTTKAAGVQVVPLYDCGAIVVVVRGATGEAGTPGSDGSDGSNGSSASSDDFSAGNGGNGGDGGDGGDGGPGGPGPAVDVALGIATSKVGPLAVARITPAGGAPRYAVVALVTGRLVIDARGGNGGPGGRGGSGGKGGKGGSNSGSGGDGSSGSDGSDGSPGSPGIGGPGGMVIVRYDAAHPELLDLVEADTRGGQGRSNGRDGAPLLSAPGDARVLFAAEIARGIPIVTGGPDDHGQAASSR